MRNFKESTLEGKTALITGGGGLLGPQHAIALSLAGAKIILIDIDQNGLIMAEERVKSENSGVDIESFNVDITNITEIESLSLDLNNRNIPVDILVNNAALNPKMNDLKEISGKIEDYDMVQFNNELSVGITGAFICSRVFGVTMAKNEGGSIINISSDLAIRAPDQRVYSPTESFEDINAFKPIGYSIVKTSMIGMTKYLAEYWGRKKVRVNALLPGGIYIDQPDFLYQNVKKRTLLNRWANINDYEDAIVFLASDSSSYMTGQSIIMDGGRSV